MSRSPVDSTEFSSAITLDDLIGCYDNIGDGGDKSYDKALSQAIWPNTEIQHDTIQYIHVLKETEESLLVEGISYNAVVFSQTFIEGLDFTINRGEITIHNKLSGSLAYLSGNPFIGVAHESTTLGLNRQGDGKLLDTTTVIGTAYLFIPIAGHMRNNYRFGKVGNECGGS